MLKAHLEMLHFAVLCCMKGTHALMLSLQLVDNA